MEKEVGFEWTHLAWIWCSVDANAEAFGWLHCHGLSGIALNSLGAWNNLDLLTVNVVDLDNVVGDDGLMVDLIFNDLGLVMMVAVDGEKFGFIVSCVIVVLADDGLKIAVVGLNNSLLGWELNLLASGDAWSDWWWSPA